MSVSTLIPAAFPALALAHFLALLSPGPDFFLIIGHAVRHRLRGSLFICLGIALGNALYICLAVSGWSVMRQMPALYRLLELAGAAYLAWLGFLVGMLLLLLSFAFFPKALNTYGMYWHPFLLIAPAICAGFCAFFHKVQKAAALFAPLRVIGNASFEIFLFNAWIEVLGKRFHLAQTPLEWLLWSIGSVAVGCLYHEVVKACSKRVKRA